MKNALVVFVLLALIANANCQKTDTASVAAPLTKEDYLKRAKDQNIGGFVTLGAGIGLMVGGVVMASRSVFDDQKFQTAEVVFVIGVLTSIISIPVFISAGKNRKRAAAISAGNFKYPVMQEKSIARVNPAITLKVQLKRLSK